MLYNLGQFTIDAKDSLNIPPNLFSEDKTFISIDIPFCERNEDNSKRFNRKFHHFTNGKHRIGLQAYQNMKKHTRYIHSLKKA